MSARMVPDERLTEMQAALDVALKALTAAQNQVETLSRTGRHDAAARGALQIRGAMEAWARLLDALERRIATREQRSEERDVEEEPTRATAARSRARRTRASAA